MYYVCIEKSIIISILNYEPNVPATVSVFEITDEEYEDIKDQTKYFDVSLKKIVSSPDSVLEEKEKQQKNAIEREFLDSTDWIVLRHLRQKYLELTSSLSEEEFKKLEMQRHEASLKIIE